MNSIRITLLAFSLWPFIVGLLVVFIISLVFKFKFKSLRKISKYLFFFLILATFSFYGVRTQTISDDTLKTIAHAGGGISELDHDYLNALEGFEEQYENGIRIFEFDVMFTSDEKLVLTHDFTDDIYRGAFNDSTPTLLEFEEHSLLLEYDTLTIYDLRQIMVDNPDFKVVIDTKEEDILAVYGELLSVMNDDNLLERIIPQLYELDTYDDIELIYDFDTYIFTLYKLDSDISESIIASKDYEEISIITIDIRNLDSLKVLFDLYQSNKDIYVHTVNSEFDSLILYFAGVNGIYTDKLVGK